jgi:hypothetical protein
MDGVVANFEKEMRRMNPDEFDDVSFRNAVRDQKIFLKLEKMPNADKLLRVVKDFRDVRREMLTSVGIENDPAHKALVIEQKSKWLLANGIGFKPNFVEKMTKKGEYADEFSILIDDTERAINAFRENGGIGILYRDDNVDDAIAQLKKAVYDIKAKIGEMY